MEQSLQRILNISYAAVWLTRHVKFNFFAMRISTGDTLRFWKYLLVVLVRRDDARGAAEALGAQCKQATNLSPGYTIDPNARDSLTGSGGRPLGIHLISGYICCESEIKDVQNDVSGDSKSSSVAVVRPRNQTDLAGDVYYCNKLEFAFDAGWLPIFDATGINGNASISVSP